MKTDHDATCMMFGSVLCTNYNYKHLHHKLLEPTLAQQSYNTWIHWNKIEIIYK